MLRTFGILRKMNKCNSGTKTPREFLPRIKQTPHVEEMVSAGIVASVIPINGITGTFSA